MRGSSSTLRLLLPHELYAMLYAPCAPVFYLRAEDLWFSLEANAKMFFT